jgi:hypothetical protein
VPDVVSGQRRVLRRVDAADREVNAGQFPLCGDNVNATTGTSEN